MADARPKFNFRIAELLPLARLLRASYVRDQAALADLLPDDYTPAYLASYDEQIAAVEKLVRTSVSIAERGVVTARIAQALAALPQLLDHLEARVRKAEGLTMPAPSFGIKAVRAARNAADHEDLADALRTLLHNISQNDKALLLKGQKPTETQQIQDLYDQLVTDSTAQGTSFSNQRVLTADNAATLNALYDQMVALLADGKALYKSSDKARLKDYTLDQLLKRVRRDPAAPEEAAKKA